MGSRGLEGHAGQWTRQKGGTGGTMQGDACTSRPKRCTNGSKRARKAKKERMSRWGECGLSVGSVNMAGFSLFKLFLLLEQYALDVLCVQEMWLPPSAIAPSIPNF